VEGRRQGTWVRFWKTGGRRAQANFENDEEHGILVLWDPLGRVEREIPFVHGEPG
jgi:antitoxin component YwqK of YwqJK toxin-antitoxin module